MRIATNSNEKLHCIVARYEADLKVGVVLKKFLKFIFDRKHVLQLCAIDCRGDICSAIGAKAPYGLTRFLAVRIIESYS